MDTEKQPDMLHSMQGGDLLQMSQGSREGGFFKSMLNRLRDIFKPNFVAEVIAGNKTKNSWKFWFFSNLILAGIFTVVAIFAFHFIFKKGMHIASEKYSSAAIEMKDGKLITSGIDDPIFSENKKDNTVFVLDTKEGKYAPAILDAYNGGVFISAEKIYSKENRIAVKESSFAKSQDFKYSFKDVEKIIYAHTLAIYLAVGLIVFVSVYFYFSIISLLFVLWWAAILWIIGLLAGVKELNFGKAFLAVLNLYIIKLIIVDCFGLLHFSFMFFSTLLMLAVFAVNIYKLKQLEKENAQVIS